MAESWHDRYISARESGLSDTESWKAAHGGRAALDSLAASRNSCAVLNWPRITPRYAPDFAIGSEDESGAHRRDVQGWPYSIYRRATETGATDVVLCHGIQTLTDAAKLCEIINAAQLQS